MISLPDKAAMTAALKRPLSSQLRALLADRIHDAVKTDLIDLTHVVVIEAGDRDEKLVTEIGLGLLTNPLDGSTFGSRAFEPHWDWLDQHDGWFEFIVTVGNDGFAFVILVEESPAADPWLMELCRAYSPGGVEGETAGADT